MTKDGRALVLAGGGVAGIAWELGVLGALRDAGVDLTAADLVVGTSAGATVGAQIATGHLDAARAAQRSDDHGELPVTLDIEEYRARSAALAEGAADGAEVRRRIGAMALAATTVPEVARRAVIAKRLPAHEWPDRRLVVTAVDAADGSLVTFDRTSGVAIVDAVAASCAVPGIWPPVTINGRRYVDGGAHSITNADLAAGFGRVVVLLPMALIGPAVAQFEHEVAILGADAAVHVIAADDATIRAFGPNPLDPAVRPVALAAGAAQAAAHVDALRALWADPARRP